MNWKRTTALIAGCLLGVGCGIDPGAELLVTPQLIEFDLNDPYLGAVVRLLVPTDSTPVELGDVTHGDGAIEFIGVGRASAAMMPDLLEPGEGWAIRVAAYGGDDGFPGDGFWGEVVVDSSAGPTTIDVFGCFGPC